MSPSTQSPPLNVQVREYWESEPCGTGSAVVEATTPHSPEWFARVEENRYQLEPFIHQIAQFTRQRGKTVLEVGVGAGTDHLQFARAGAICHGVDLTDAAISTTRARLALEGLTSQLQRIDAESLPFATATFDVVYSWGVIHHSNDPKNIACEIHRVLKPGGTFIGMVYSRRSILAFKLWVRNALLAGRPLRSFADVIWHHMESVGTKAYTPDETRELLACFASVNVIPILTPYDKLHWPTIITTLLPTRLGWFLAFNAMK